jgi:hypothetical protein
VAALAAHKPVSARLAIHDPKFSSLGAVRAADAFRFAELFPFDQVLASDVGVLSSTWGLIKFVHVASTGLPLKIDWFVKEFGIFAGLNMVRQRHPQFFHEFHDFLGIVFAGSFFGDQAPGTYGFRYEIGHY